MAPTDNVPSSGSSEASSLLNFVSVASSNIQQALNSKKSKKVNHRKYISKRVNTAPKRLGDSHSKPPRKIKPCGSALPKGDSGVHSSALFAQPWVQPASVVYTSEGESYSSESSLYAPVSIDPELDNLLCEFGYESPHNLSRRGSEATVYTEQHSLENQVYLGERPFSPYSDCSDEPFQNLSRRGSEATTAYSQQPSLENQVYLGEHPFSPYSDCSDDSAYSSPCSHTNSPSTTLTTGCVEWSASSPHHDVMSTVYDQGIPMTPTVSQILDSFAA